MSAHDALSAQLASCLSMKRHIPELQGVVGEVDLLIRHIGEVDCDIDGVGALSPLDGSDVGHLFLCCAGSGTST